MKIMKLQPVTDMLAGILILLFIYAALSKLLDLPEYRLEMNRQAFSGPLKVLLFWLVPLAELLAAALLAFQSSRLYGFYSSCGLLLIFTGYISLVLTHYFPVIPCSCGGVLKMLSWQSHFFFNLFFLLISFLGIFFAFRERRSLH